MAASPRALLAIVAVVVAAAVAPSAAGAGTIPTKATGAVMGAFVADSLALATHLCFDTQLIEEVYQTTNASMVNLTKPTAAEYRGSSQRYHLHANVGEFTHYGDQILWMLEDVSLFKRFDSIRFARTMQDKHRTYRGKRDESMLHALKAYNDGEDHLNAGHPTAEELGVAARIAPMALVFKTEQELAMGARMQVLTTNKSRFLLDVSEFWARVMFRVLHKKLKPTEAIEKVAKGEKGLNRAGELALQGLKTKNEDSEAAVKKFAKVATSVDGKFKYPGAKGSDAMSAMPLVAHLIGKYESDLQGALVANVMLGGESAARGHIIGFVLGAYHGEDKIPARWVDSLAYKGRILEGFAETGKMHRRHDEL